MQTRNILLMVALLAPTWSLGAVSVDGLYDFRHSTDPQDNANNFPVVELKVFIPQDYGTFLMKEEIDLNGSDHNASQIFSEISQNVKLGSLTLQDRPLFLHLEVSGGLGLFGNATGGFYMQNAYIVGLEYPFSLQGAFCDVYLALRDSNYEQSRFGPMLAAYGGRKFFHDKVLIAHSLEAWMTPESTGRGNVGSWELESEAWYAIAAHFSVGTYIRTTRNVYALSNRWVVYPSFGVRYSF